MYDLFGEEWGEWMNGDSKMDEENHHNTSVNRLSSGDDTWQDADPDPLLQAREYSKILHNNLGKIVEIHPRSELLVEEQPHECQASRSRRGQWCPMGQATD